MKTSMLIPGTLTLAVALVINITWASGTLVVVEGCTNVANPTWVPLQTCTLTDGSIYFSDITFPMPQRGNLTTPMQTVL